MTDKSSLLKNQGSLYLEFIPKDGLFHKMLLLSLMGFLTGWCNIMTEPCLLQCKPLTWAAWRVTQSKIQILQGICNESISGINNYENMTEPKGKSQKYSIHYMYNYK